VNDLGTIDFFTNKQVADNPYPYFEQLRAKGNVYREPHHGVVAITGYEEAAEVLNDHERFSSCISVTGPFPPLPFAPVGADISELIEAHRQQLPFNGFVSTQDPPQHTKTRALLTRLFVPRRMSEIESKMYRLSDSLLDRLLPAHRCEFTSQYAEPFSIRVIAELLGISDADREDLEKIVRHNFEILSHGEERRRSELLKNPMDFLTQLFTRELAERRRDLRQDVLSDLALATFPDGSSPEPAEVARMASYLFGAGQDTTAILLSSLLRALADNPTLQAQLRAEPNLIPAFIEELLRLEPPVKCSFRLARVTTTIGGVEITAGSVVMVLPGAVNRDPLRFDKPEQFRLDRSGRHFSFGRGIHVCPGNVLARMEARVTVERLLARTREIRAVESEHGPLHSRRYNYDPIYILRKLKALHLEFALD
jgi:cytochrome P450